LASEAIGTGTRVVMAGQKRRNRQAPMAAWPVAGQGKINDLGGWRNYADKPGGQLSALAAYYRYRPNP